MKHAASKRRWPGLLLLALFLAILAGGPSFIALQGYTVRNPRPGLIQLGSWAEGLPNSNGSNTGGSSSDLSTASSTVAIAVAAAEAARQARLHAESGWGSAAAAAAAKQQEALAAGSAAAEEEPEEAGGVEGAASAGTVSGASSAAEDRLTDDSDHPIKPSAAADSSSDGSSTAAAAAAAGDEEEGAGVAAGAGAGRDKEAWAAATGQASAALVYRWPWYDISRSVGWRVDALMERLTSQHKLGQLRLRGGNGIAELGVPEVDWQEECSYGLRRWEGDEGAVASSDSSGSSSSSTDAPHNGTIFPIPIAWAATFDDHLAYAAAQQIGDEMRAEFNWRLLHGAKRVAYSHCLGPRLQVARDPRMGLIGESYGEDPMVNARMAIALVAGLQGNDGTYIKTGATCQFYIGHGLQGQHADFSANISTADLRDTYLPPFEACVRDPRAAAIMCSHSLVNGQSTCSSERFLKGVLRTELGLQGLIMEPPPGAEPGAGAAEGSSTRQAAAKAFKSGIDMSFASFGSLRVEDIGEAELDTAVRRVLTARVRQGHFNPPTDLPYDELERDTIGRREHVATAKELAAKSIVLLKNQGDLLPLADGLLKRVAVIGPFADMPPYIIGRHAVAGRVITPLQALQEMLPAAEILYDHSRALQYSVQNARADAASCQSADVCFLFLGNRMAGKQSHLTKKFKSSAYDSYAEGEGLDRASLGLNENQEQLWRAIANATDKPLIVVLFTGGPLDVAVMHHSPRVGAILTAWHPGQYGSQVLVDMIFGKFSPSGRLPISWYHDSSFASIPITDMRMRPQGDFPGRTYRYWRGGKPLYRFGYGLSYVDWKFMLGGVQVGLNASTKDAVALAGISIKNGGGRKNGTAGMPADTSILVFLKYLGPDPEAGRGKRGVLPDSGCNPNATSSDLRERLVGYYRTGTMPFDKGKRLVFSLRLGPTSASAWAGFGDPAPPCGSYAVRFGVDLKPAATIVLQP